VKTIELTDREISLLMAALHTHATALEGSGSPELAELHAEVNEIEDDLRELLHRNDGWGTDNSDDDFPLDDAERFLRTKIIATPGSSRAADRRVARLKGVSSPGLSQMGVANDPIDW